MKSLKKIFHVGIKNAAVTSNRRSLTEIAPMKRLQLIVAVVIIFAGIMGGNANASSIYNWVCDNADCNGDPAFSSSIEISDTAFAAGDFTGVTGNILSWTTTSGVGSGYTLTLGDIMAGSGNTDDINNVRIVLIPDKTEIADLLDISAGTNITFFNSSVGRVDFFEGTSGAYSVGSLQDATMIVNSEFSPIHIAGRFVRQVPEPSTFLLLGSGLAGLAFYRRKKA